MTCDFSLKTTDAASSSLPRSPAGASEIRSSDSHAVERSLSLSTPYTGGSAVRPTDLHMGDLELLHHFTTETCFTLSDQPQSHRLWQIAVPQEAFRHDFLMRGLLAVAALHLAHLRPEKQEGYRQVAVQHQHLALSSFRLVMSKMDQSNCHAFFALSSLIVVFAFASPRASESLAFTENSQEPPEWLPLIRGVHSILMSVWPWIKNGSLGGLLQDGIEQPNQRELSEAAGNQFNQLLRLCQNAAGDQEVIDAYRIAVEELRNCYVKLYTKVPTECEVSIAFLWPVVIPQKFIHMLNARSPEALIVLAHYCVLLHHLEGYWWKRGWTAHLMANIYRELDEPWHSWIQWPMSIIQMDHCSDRIITPAH